MKKNTFKTLVFVFACFLCQIQVVKAQFADDFTDGDLTNNPTWVGETSKFMVNAQKQLQLQAPATGSPASIATPSQAINAASWEFLVKFNFGAAPSSSNYCDVYVASNASDLNQTALNGYFVRIGFSDKDVSLFKQQGTTQTKIIDGQNNRVNQNNVNVKIKLTRDNNGNFQLFSDSLGANNYKTEGSVLDNAIVQSQFFGVKCVFTSTRSDKFAFDDFNVSGTPFSDNQAPTVSSVALSNNKKTVEIQFSEPLQTPLAQNTANYVVNNGIGNPTTATLNAAQDKVTLDYPNPFANGSIYTLNIQNLKDLAGNTMLPYATTFGNYEPQRFDVLINEIMPDPEPAVQLPNAEFVELYNRSNFAINLKDFKFGDASGLKTLPQFILNPNDYVILCSSTTANLFQNFGNVLAISSFPSLNNDQDKLYLYDKNEVLMDYVNYSDSWYKSNAKKNGGWSLERIDAQNPCATQTNWRASNDTKGGTPAKINSVKGSISDNSKPELLRANVIAADTLELIFSESLKPIMANNLNNYLISPNIGILDASIVQPELNKVRLVLANGLQIRTIYTIATNNIEDCVGNKIENNTRAKVAIAEQADSNDVVINEILFYPKTGGKDFVELYNRSQKIIDLKTLNIANADDNNQLDQIKPITAASYLLFPNEYVVVSEDNALVKLFYNTPNPNNFIDTEGTMPSMASDKDRIILCNKSLKTIDQVNYNKNWHYQLIGDEQGVSLERLDPNRVSNDKSNWFSAASTVGFATPGYKNSQSKPQNATLTDGFLLQKDLVSPNNDGQDDQLTINYNFQNAGTVANISVYTIDGFLVKEIAKSELLPKEGSINWDCTTANSDAPQKMKSGVYILAIEAFNLNGEQSRTRKSFVVNSQQ